MGRIIFAVSNDEVESEARALCLDIMRMAEERGSRVEVVARAAAYLVATAAAKLDRDEGRQSIKGRLDAFCALTEETYEKMRNWLDGSQLRDR